MDVSPSGGGTVQIDENALTSYPVTLTFSSGSYVQLEAVPADGFEFDSWTGDLSGTVNPTTIVIDCNKKITAHFSQVAGPSWWLISGIIAGLIIVGATIGAIARRRVEARGEETNSVESPS